LSEKLNYFNEMAARDAGLNTSAIPDRVCLKLNSHTANSVVHWAHWDRSLAYRGHDLRAQETSGWTGCSKRGATF
jgi:hypothetical protein